MRVQATKKRFYTAAFFPRTAAKVDALIDYLRDTEDKGHVSFADAVRWLLDNPAVREEISHHHMRKAQGLE